ncbi:hypothetical protein BJY04DRAFT_216719 [Aspergillus karnatakaensis]|uniref:uncharacterized protein n=1 Tax=Aspergillus karnatakaensis TaxID=1810916 RepID=UPI003CCD1DF5
MGPQHVSLLKAFTKAFQSLKDTVERGYNITISSAVIIQPEFLDRFFEPMVLKAAMDAGIRPIGSLVTSRKLVYEDFVTSLYWKNHSGNGGKKPSLLFFNQGWGWLEIMTAGRDGWEFYPVDHLGCQWVTSMLVERLLERSLVLKEDVERGADESMLAKIILRARTSLLDNMESPTEAANDQDDQARVLEWPLDLDGWLVSEEREQVNLHWNDIDAVNTGYVDELARSLGKAFRVLKSQCVSPHL